MQLIPTIHDGWRAPRLWSWIGLGLVVALFCLPLFVGLGQADLGNDEAIYAFAVDVMVRSGDWLTPKSAPHDDVPFLEKPPLKIWIVAAAIRLGLLPHDEFGLRFWDAAFSGVAFLYVFAIGRRLAGPLCGVAAVLMLLVHWPLLFAHGLRSHNMEAATVLCYCGGVHHFLAWRAGGEGAGARRHAAGVALYFVLGFMTKFVAALFLPLVLGVAVILTRDDRARLRRDWAAWVGAGLLAIALIAPWFVYQYLQFGDELWTTMFGAHVVTRFTSYLDPAHLRPWQYYVSELLRQLRWSGALAVSVAGMALLVLASVRRGRRDAVVILVWFALPLALISLLSSKLYHYVYPFLPPLALAAGYAVAMAARLAWSLLAHLLSRVGPATRDGEPAVAARLRAGLLLAARVGLVSLVVLALLPVAAYRRNLSFLSTAPHPLRSARDCLERIRAALGGPDTRGPGVWVEAESLSHVYYYYLKGLGPWHLRDYASDPTVYMHLYAPAHYRPVLLSRSRFESFIRLAQAGDLQLIERVARKASLDPSALAASARETHVAQVWFGPDVLMLPGPYAACAARE